MQLGIPRESLPGETRVAATPETVKKYIQAGHQVILEQGAGLAARYPDQAYQDAGAQIADAAQALACPVVLKVRSPSARELEAMTSGSVLVGMLDPFNQAGLAALPYAGLTAISPEAAPRTHPPHTPLLPSS